MRFKTKKQKSYRGDNMKYTNIISEIKNKKARTVSKSEIYDMYLKINEYIDDSDPKYEEDAIELEKQFQKKLTNYHK